MTSLRHLVPFAVWLAALPVLASSAVPAAETPPASGGFEIVFERVLPAPIEWAFDVRWSDDEHLLVSAGRTGVFEVSVSKPDAPLRRLSGSGGLTYAGPLAVSEGYVATAFSAGVFAWRSRGAPTGWSEDVPMAVIVDLDVSADHVLFLGARRVAVPGKKRAQWAPRGGILFRGDLRGDPTVLDLVMTARSGADGMAMEMAYCHVLNLGAVRFLRDGRHAVVPGVQPGVFVYGTDGRLIHAWDGASLGIYDHCEIDDRQKAAVGRHMEARNSWWQAHTVLDDLVPWGDWFAVLVRTPREGGADWSFHPFDGDGPLPAVKLPVSGDSPGRHVRADSRGDRLALLLFDYEEAERLGPPRHPPRLLVLKRTMQ